MSPASLKRIINARRSGKPRQKRKGGRSEPDDGKDVKYYTQDFKVSIAACRAEINDKAIHFGPRFVRRASIWKHLLGTSTAKVGAFTLNHRSVMAAGEASQIPHALTAAR